MGDQGDWQPDHGGGAAATPGTRPTDVRDRDDGHSAATTPYQRSAAYAAIDLGTNNCRLLIARPAADGFTIIDAFSRIVRLGEGLAASGRIGEAAMVRALDALAICGDKLARRRVNLSRAVATEACRQAGNGAEFVARVYERTGIALDVISAREEARLAMMGCHQLLEAGPGPGLIFDIGGGSTELVLIDDSVDPPLVRDWESIPWGVVSLTEAVPHDSHDPDARRAAYREMRARVRDDFAQVRERLVAASDGQHAALRLLGTSGTVTTLGSLYLNLPAYDRRQVDGLVVPTQTMRDVCTRLADLSLTEREQLPCIGRERADLVVAGCAIFEEICDIWPAARLGVADRGIREGVLRQLMASQQRERRAW